MKFVDKNGVSTDEMREMLSKYLKLDNIQKDKVKEQLSCSKSISDLDFLSYIRMNGLHRKFMNLL
jgi:hypothetical protein